MSREYYYEGRLSINQEKTSPYWMVTFQGKDGKMRRRSTKVPVAGGMFEGTRITARLAEKIACQRGVQIACREELEYQSHNNVSARKWLAERLEQRGGSSRKTRSGTRGLRSSTSARTWGQGRTGRCRALIAFW